MPWVRNTITGDEQVFDSWDHIRLRIEDRRLFGSLEVRASRADDWQDPATHPELSDLYEQPPEQAPEPPPRNPFDPPEHLRAEEVKPWRDLELLDNRPPATGESVRLFVDKIWALPDTSSRVIGEVIADQKYTVTMVTQVGGQHWCLLSAPVHGFARRSIAPKPAAETPPPPPPPPPPQKQPEKESPWAPELRLPSRSAPEKPKITPPPEHHQEGRSFWKKASSAGVALSLLGAITYVVWNGLTGEAPATAGTQEGAPTSDPNNMASIDSAVPAVMQVSEACRSVRMRTGPSTATPMLLEPATGNAMMLQSGYAVRAIRRVADEDFGAGQTWIEVSWPKPGYVAERGFSACPGGFLVKATPVMEAAVIESRVETKPVPAGLRLKARAGGTSLYELPSLQPELGKEKSVRGGSLSASGRISEGTLLIPAGITPGLRGSGLDGIWYWVTSPVAGYVLASAVEPVQPTAEPPADLPAPAAQASRPASTPTAASRHDFPAPAHLRADEVTVWRALNLTEYRQATSTDRPLLPLGRIYALPLTQSRDMGTILSDQNYTVYALANVSGQQWCQLSGASPGFAACVISGDAPPTSSRQTTSAPAAPSHASGPPPQPASGMPGASARQLAGAGSSQALSAIVLESADIASRPDESRATRILSRHVRNRTTSRASSTTLTATLHCYIAPNRDLTACMVISMEPDSPGYRKAAAEIAEAIRVTTSAQRRIGTAKIELPLSITLGN